MILVPKISFGELFTAVLHANASSPLCQSANRTSFEAFEAKCQISLCLKDDVIQVAVNIAEAIQLVFYKATQMHLS
jgi:hypothetical protein